ncbi:MAG: HD domain-containing protein [Clostridia bacterium]|nr:HD domain-containing protein [Clostridia bacterium]
MKNIIDKLKEKIKEYFEGEDTGHDISHLERVYDFALEIQKIEGGDLYIIAVSSLVHDIHRILSNKYGRFVSAEESLDDVKNLLIECDVDLEKLEAILEVVKFHDSKEIKELPIEALIIQDADALDAVGKVGLERTLKYCKKYNIPIIDKSFNLDCKEYIPNTNPISTCHYIYRTMIPNGKNLYTKTAKILANEKMQVLYDFIKANTGINIEN